ncbi:BatA domain-containing protein [Erythrobacter sp. R86502]|uniref:BatA domain-containing protein n=1 Tax=Erythrobacter sp. R86502 TaxID=3093846 RepID=UPI0036D2E63B
MTLTLLAPFGLAALAALIVPLLIHLHRRTEEVPVDFAALRWLSARPRPRSKLRFDELLLLALRLLLIALLALLLARPALMGQADDSAVVLVAPEIAPAAARAAKSPDADMRWIAPGFPSIDTAPPAAHTVQFSSLLRQFDSELAPDRSLTVLVPPVLSGVDADRLTLTRKVSWQVIERPSRDDMPTVPDLRAIAIRYANDGAGAVRYFRAAASAWSENPRFDARMDDTLPPRDHVLVWLVPGRVPASVMDWVGVGGTALLGVSATVAMPDTAAPVWRDAVGEPIVEGGPSGAGRLLRFTRPLSPSAMPALVDADFAARLRDLVSPAVRPPGRVMAAAFAPNPGAAPYRQVPFDMSSWLGVAIALLFALERIVATRRGRFAP